MNKNNFLWIFNRIVCEIKMRFHNEYSLPNFFRSELGINIGSGCRIIGKRFHMFGSEPYLIEIGNRVTIAEDVKFITHDGGASILRDQLPDINVFGRIVIRDNCFIGVNSILMPNITIGPNSVVGAGAVVTKDVPPNTIVAGVPARVIMSIDEYKAKLQAKGFVISEHDPVKRRDEILAHLNSSATD